MSREYYFYPAEKKQDGYYYPALLKPDNDKYDPAECYWTNADCISDESKDLLEDVRIDPGNMKGGFVKYMGLDKCNEKDLERMYIYELSNDFIRAHSGTGLIIGYLPVDTAIEADQCNVPLSEYKYKMITPEIYAEHPHKENYMRVSFVDHMSLEYICGILDIVLCNLECYKKDLCVLLHYSF